MAVNKSKLSLRIVLVLSIIGSGISFLSYSVVGLFYNQYQALFASMPEGLPEEMAVALEMLVERPRALFLLLGIFSGLSLLGVILMWNIRRSGFHCYTLAQLILLTLPVIFLGKSSFAIGDAMLTLLFVVYYYTSLRMLGAFSNQPDSPQSDQSDDNEGKNAGSHEQL